ncbi:MAG: hypothetical protein ACRDRL_33130, partial [Sciscionella sp.]
MISIGITGHSNLTTTSVPIVAEAIRRTLRYRHAGTLATMTGLTCLARGADQIFAQAVLDLGGRVEVVLPASDYRERKVKPANAAQFDDLISQASAVHTMPFSESNRDAY